MGMYTWRNWRDVKDTRALENIRAFTSYAIQSQYSASRRILALAAGYQKRIDPYVDVGLFYRTMFDIYTAQGVGLDNWGVILQIGRTIPGPYMGDCFGFHETPPLPAEYSGPRFQPFNQYPFTPDSGSDARVAMITLDDELFRLLLLYKALANISASDAATQNKLLSVLIDTGIGGDLLPLLGGTDVSGPSPETRPRRSKRLPALPPAAKVAYVLEIDTMVIRWVFEDVMTPLQRAVFQVAGTLARGAGVGWELYAVNPGRVFGFYGSEMQPFNQAPFAGDKSLIINRS